MATPLKNGDIILVNFPFTDLKGMKVRPALVISTAMVHQHESDLTLLFISSVIPSKIQSYEFLFPETHPDFAKSGLKKVSLFKTSKVVTVQKKLAVRKLGTLGDRVRKELASVFEKAVQI